jgi:hypothetical protein
MLYSVCTGSDAMDAKSLDADFYRERARLCYKLAEAAQAAKPLFARLVFLAKAYEERAATATLKVDRERATEDSRSRILAASLTSPAA